MSCPIHGDAWCTCHQLEPQKPNERVVAMLVDAMPSHERTCAVHSPTLRPCSCGLETRLRDRIGVLTETEREHEAANVELAGEIEKRDNRIGVIERERDLLVLQVVMLKRELGETWDVAHTAQGMVDALATADQPITD